MIKELADEKIEEFIDLYDSKNTRKVYKMTLDNYKHFCSNANVNWMDQDSAITYFEHIKKYSLNTQRVRRIILNKFFAFNGIEGISYLPINYIKKEKTKDIIDLINLLIDSNPNNNIDRNQNIRKTNKFELSIRNYLFLLVILFSDLSIEEILNMKDLPEKLKENELIDYWYNEYIDTRIYKNKKTPYFFCNNQHKKLINANFIVKYMSAESFSIAEIQRLLKGKTLILLNAENFYSLF